MSFSKCFRLSCPTLRGQKADFFSDSKRSPGRILLSSKNSLKSGGFKSGLYIVCVEQSLSHNVQQLIYSSGALLFRVLSRKLITRDPAAAAASAAFSDGLWSA